MMPAGIAFNYANPNFALAGFITEVLDGRSWPAIVTADVLAPLGPRSTRSRAATTRSRRASHSRADTA